MGAELNFDATGVKPSSPNDPIPAGWHRMAIVASEVKPTKDGQGKYLELEHEALEGEHKGRKAWARLNVQNKNETTQRIAQEQLSAICHATGVMKLSNSSQLHNIPMLVKLTVKKDDGYDPTNDFKGWKAIDGKAPAAVGTPAAATSAAAPQSSANAPAWAQKKSA